MMQMAAANDNGKNLENHFLLMTCKDDFVHSLVR